MLFITLIFFSSIHRNEHHAATGHDEHHAAVQAEDVCGRSHHRDPQRDGPRRNKADSLPEPGEEAHLPAGSAGPLA